MGGSVADINLEVGQSVLIVDMGYQTRVDKEGLRPYYECTIEKVGRLYFYISFGGSSLKFNKFGSNREMCDFCRDRLIYKDLDTYKGGVNKQERYRYCMNNYFATYEVPDITIDQLERVITIMEEKKV